jgi:hypothetical protein
MDLNQSRESSEQRLMVWLDAAGSMFGGMPPNPSAKQVWGMLMSKYSPEQVDLAFVQWMETAKKMPVPSDIKDIIEGGSAKEKALSAWTKVVAAMGDVGSHKSICFDDLLIHLVIGDMGGWTMLCNINDEKLPFAGHDFQKRYLSLLAKPRESLGAVPRSLAGSLAVGNSGNKNSPNERVVLYGDRDMAEMVFDGGFGDGPAVLTYRRPSIESLGYTPSISATDSATRQLL